MYLLSQNKQYKTTKNGIFLIENGIFLIENGIFLIENGIFLDLIHGNV